MRKRTPEELERVTDRVMELKDKHGVEFPAIAQRLGMTPHQVRLVYRKRHEEQIAAAEREQ